MKITGNEPANPTTTETEYPDTIVMPDIKTGHATVFETTKRITTNHRGLTIRQQFAMAAMQGLVTRVPKRYNEETDLGILECKRISK